jgi:hypothetical protein
LYDVVSKRERALSEDKARENEADGVGGCRERKGCDPWKTRRRVRGRMRRTRTDGCSCSGAGLACLNAAGQMSDSKEKLLGPKR